MAVKWSSYVWEDTDYKNGELLVALALADFANDEGYCYPFVETVAKKARLSVRQTQRIFQLFEEDGFLEMSRKQGRGLRPEIWLKKLPTKTPFAERKKVTNATGIEEQKGDKCDIEKVTNATEKGDKSDTEKVTFATSPIYKDEPSHKPLLEPSSEPSERETLSPAPDENLPDKNSSEIADEVFGEITEPDADEETEIFLSGMRERLNAPVHLPDGQLWLGAFMRSFENGYAASHFLETFDLLETIKTLKLAHWHITWQMVERNVGKTQSLKLEIEKLKKGEVNKNGHKNGSKNSERLDELIEDSKRFKRPKLN